MKYNNVRPIFNFCFISGMKYFVLIAFIFINYLSFAQVDTIYYNRNWDETIRDNASYYRILKEVKEGKWWTFEDYYLNNEQLQNKGALSQLSPEVRENEFIWYYPNGEKKLEGNYVKNDREDTWVAYFRSGQKRYKGKYKKGKRIGEWKWYHENKQLKSRAVYETGTLVGERKWWYESGKIESKVNYLSGKQHGSREWWYENGQLKEQTAFENGIRHGESRQWYQSGEIKCKIVFESGILVEERWWKKSGDTCSRNEVVHEKNAYNLLWEISGNGLTQPSYLFGTMHVRHPRAFEFSDSLIDIFESCDGYSMEILPDSLFAYHFESDEQLLNHNENGNEMPVSYENKSSYLDFLYSDGNWYLNLNDLFHRSGGISANQMPYFLDAYLYYISKTKGKSVFPLETVADHISTGQKLPSYQERFDILSRFDPTQEMIEVYEQGNIEQIEALMDLFSSEEFKYRLLIERNYKMAESIDRLMKERSMFNTCGSAHLPGEEGIIQILRDKGYKLRAVQGSFNGDSINYEYDASKLQNYEIALEESDLLIKLPGIPFSYDKGNFKTQIHMDFIGEVGYEFFMIPAYQFSKNSKHVLTEHHIKDFITSNFGEASKVTDLDLSSTVANITFIDGKSHFHKTALFYEPYGVIILDAQAAEKQKLNSDFVARFLQPQKNKQETITSRRTIHSTRNFYSVEFPLSVTQKLLRSNTENVNYFEDFVVEKYSGMDLSNGKKYIARSEIIPPNYYDKYGEIYMEDLKETLIQKFDKSNYEMYLKSDNLAYEWSFHPEKHQQLFVRSILKGNRHYYLMTEGADKADAEQFFKSFKTAPIEYKAYDTIAVTDEYGVLFFEDYITDKVTEYYTHDIWGDYSYVNADQYEEPKKEINVQYYDTTSGIVLRVKEIEFSKYFQTNNIDSLKKYYLNSVFEDCYDCEFEENGYSMSASNKETNITTCASLHEYGNNFILVSAIYPQSDFLDSLCPVLTNSVTFREDKTNFDFESDKLYKLLDDLSSKDSVIKSNAMAIFNQFHFKRSNSPLLIETLKLEVRDDTLKNTRLTQNVFDKLLEINDTSLVNSIDSLANNFVIDSNLYLKIAELYAGHPSKKSISKLVGMLNSEEILSFYDKKRIFNSLTYNLETQSSYLKLLLPVLELPSNTKFFMNLVAELITSVESDEDTKLFLNLFYEQVCSKIQESDYNFEKEEYKQFLQLLLKYKPRETCIYEYINNQHAFDDNNIKMLEVLVLLNANRSIPRNQLQEVFNSLENPFIFMARLNKIAHLQDLNEGFDNKMFIARYEMAHWLNTVGNYYAMSYEPRHIKFIETHKVKIEGKKAEVHVFQYHRQEFGIKTPFLALSSPQLLKEKKYDFSLFNHCQEEEFKRKKEKKEIIEKMIRNLKEHDVNFGQEIAEELY